ncbi:hypothetical protein K3162_02010 [Qipengyuania xiapuensis]|uniref:Uncharacterized protein n=1 Tax=Qipengyuania xiapuensis TaxID=2867236 RepID=A0ABX8ZV05_9SPHN|nr:hypothetical protein [Qipengyuania xiapuensis]QZD92843.1 hypothetical protein K3162_02010 [Qipengyuania xiapuensis]
MIKLLLTPLVIAGLLATPNTLSAQDDEWFVGSHPDYHAAMVRDIDGLFVAVYVAKEPTIWGSPLLMETNEPVCDTKRPMSFHKTEAIMAFGKTATDRLEVVRQTVQGFFDSATKSCSVADDLEARFFHRFDDAYLATDALLVEAGIFPLSDESSEAAAKSEDTPK